MGDIPRSLLEALVVGEFVAERLGLNEKNLMPLLAMAGGVPLNILTRYSILYSKKPYLGDLKRVGAYILTRKIGSTNLAATNVVGVLDHTTVARHADYIEGMRERHIEEVRSLLDSKRPVLEARLSDFNQGKHERANATPYIEQLDKLRNEFSLYCGRARSDEFSRLNPKEKIWLRALLLYKTLEGVEGLDESNVLPVIASISGIRTTEIKSNKQPMSISSVRQVACYAFRNLLGEKAPNYSEIGRLIGNKDHSTVMTACRKVIIKLEANAELLRYIMGGSQDRTKPQSGTAEGLPFFEHASREQIKEDYRIIGKRTNGRLEEAAALVERLQEVENLSPENILDEACRIAGTKVQDVKFGYSTRKEMAVKRAVSYIGRARLDIKPDDLAEILGYEASSIVIDHYHRIMALLDGSSSNKS